MKKVNIKKLLALEKKPKAPSFQRVPIRIQKSVDNALLQRETVLGGFQGQHQGFTDKKEMPRKILSLKNDLF